MHAWHQITVGRLLGSVALFAVTAALLRIGHDHAELRVLCGLLAFITLGMALGVPFGRPGMGLVALVTASFALFAIGLVSYAILSANGIVPIVE